jgi:hypothetical protein
MKVWVQQRESKACPLISGTLTINIKFISGTLTSLMLEKIGIRWSMFIGTLTTVAGYIATMFFPSVYVVLFTYGILPGKTM